MPGEEHCTLPLAQCSPLWLRVVYLVPVPAAARSLGGVRRVRVEGDVVSVLSPELATGADACGRVSRGHLCPRLSKLLDTDSRYCADRTKALFMARSTLVPWPLGFEVAGSPLRLKVLRHYRSGEVLLLV